MKKTKANRAKHYQTDFADKLFETLFYGHMVSTYQLAVLLDRDPASIRRTCLGLERQGLVARPPFQFTHPNFNPDDYQPLRACYDPHYNPPAQRRPLSQSYLTKANIYNIYALTSAAAKDIAEKRGLKAHGRRYNWNNKRKKDYYELPHTLGITDFLLYMQASVAHEPGLAMTWQKHLSKFHPIQFKNIYLAQAGESGNFRPEPDGFFAIEQINSNPVYFLLEYDCGTMPIARRSIHKSSLKRKVLLYDQIALKRKHQKRLGIPNFVRLWVTDTPGRAKKIIKMIEAHSPNYARFYYVTDRHSLKSKKPLDRLWRVPFKTGLAALPTKPQQI